MILQRFKFVSEFEMSGSDPQFMIAAERPATWYMTLPVSILLSVLLSGLGRGSETLKR